jgi:hypothetical protein
MAKGLILCYRDKIFAGESAGFGLPVLKTPRQTIFPSLTSFHWLPSETLEALYDLNLINTWQIFGVKAPPAFTSLMEKIVAGYMVRPRSQQTGLIIRQVLTRLFQVRSTMKPGSSLGHCRVWYKTDYNRLEVTVNGEELKSQGKLILLNEVAGIEFSRLRNGRGIRNGKNFLPWQPCSMGTGIENTGLNLGFSVSVPPNVETIKVHLAAGREIARNLNWAGLALTTDQTFLTYHVNFYLGADSMNSKS